MAREWTLARRRRQSVAIHRWKPWLQSTEPRTPEGRRRWRATPSRAAHALSCADSRVFSTSSESERTGSRWRAPRVRKPMVGPGSRMAPPPVSESEDGVEVAGRATTPFGGQSPTRPGSWCHFPGARGPSVVRDRLGEGLVDADPVPSLDAKE